MDNKDKDLLNRFGATAALIIFSGLVNQFFGQAIRHLFFEQQPNVPVVVTPYPAAEALREQQRLATESATLATQANTLETKITTEKQDFVGGLNVIKALIKAANDKTNDKVSDRAASFTNSIPSLENNTVLSEYKVLKAGLAVAKNVSYIKKINEQISLFERSIEGLYPVSSQYINSCPENLGKLRYLSHEQSFVESQLTRGLKAIEKDKILIHNYSKNLRNTKTAGKALEALYDLVATEINGDLVSKAEDINTALREKGTAVDAANAACSMDSTRPSAFYSGQEPVATP